MKAYKFRNIGNEKDNQNLIEIITGVVKLEVNSDNYKINDTKIQLETQYGTKEVIPVEGVLPGTINVEFNNSVLWHSSPDKFIDKLDVNLPTLEHLSENNILSLINPELRGYRKLLHSDVINTVGIETMQGMISSIRREIGICSLAKSYSNSQLWNEYTSNGSGVALEFEICDERIDNGYYHVDYYEDIDDLPALCLDDVVAGHNGDDQRLSKFFRELFCSKTGIYSHEDEIRHIIKKPNMYYPVGNLSRIITGPNISIENLKWIIENNPTTEIQETILVDDVVVNKI